MAAKRPEDIHTQFAAAFNNGDIDKIVSLYEPEAVLVPQPGQVTCGHTAIGYALKQFLALQGSMQIRTLFVIRGSDLALLRGQWKLTGTGHDGMPVEML